MPVLVTLPLPIFLPALYSVTCWPLVAPATLIETVIVPLVAIRTELTLALVTGTEEVTAAGTADGVGVD